MGERWAKFRDGTAGKLAVFVLGAAAAGVIGTMASNAYADAAAPGKIHDLGLLAIWLLVIASSSAVVGVYIWRSTAVGLVAPASADAAPASPVFFPPTEEPTTADDELKPVPPPDELSELVAALKAPRYRVNDRPLSAAAFVHLMRRELSTGSEMSWLVAAYRDHAREALRDLGDDLLADLSIAGVIEIERRTTTEFDDKLRTRSLWQLTPLGKQVAWRIQSDASVLSELEGFLSPVPNLIIPEVWEEVGRIIHDGRERQTAKWFATVRLIRGPETLKVPTFLDGFATGNGNRVVLPVADGEQLQGDDLNLTKWKDSRVWLFAYDKEASEFLVPQKGKDYLIPAVPNDEVSLRLLVQAPNYWFSCSMKFRRSPEGLVLTAKSGE